MTVAPPTITVAITGYPGDANGAHLDRQALILSLVASERHRQDIKWGGPSHDDGRTPEEWLGDLDRLLDDLYGLLFNDDYPWTADGLRHLIEIAAVAVAAAETAQRLGVRP